VAIVRSIGVNKSVAFATWQQRAALTLGSATLSSCIYDPFRMEFYVCLAFCFSSEYCKCLAVIGEINVKSESIFSVRRQETRN